MYLGAGLRENPVKNADEIRERRSQSRFMMPTAQDDVVSAAAAIKIQHFTESIQSMKILKDWLKLRVRVVKNSRRPASPERRLARYGEKGLLYPSTPAVKSDVVLR